MQNKLSNDKKAIGLQIFSKLLIYNIKEQEVSACRALWEEKSETLKMLIHKDIPPAPFWMHPSGLLNFKGWDKNPCSAKFNEPNPKHKYLRGAHQHTGNMPWSLLQE